MIKLLMFAMIPVLAFGQATPPPTPQQDIANSINWVNSANGAAQQLLGWSASLIKALNDAQTQLQNATPAPPDPLIAWLQSQTFGSGLTYYQRLVSLMVANAQITAIGYYCGQPPAWLVGQPYPIGAKVEDPKGNVYVLTTAPAQGQSGQIAPAWPASPKVGTTVQDGNLVWTFVSTQGEIVCNDASIIPVLAPTPVTVTPATQ
jgi:hypothetical protein